MKLININKSYGKNVIYENFDFEIEQGKITVVLGESGSGKTTLLNIIASLTDYSGVIEDKIVPMSAIFQRDLLVPNLTVKENILLFKKSADVDEELKNIGLEGKGNEYVKNLSAGMARRVSILRGILYPSNLILMDEPFINLDLALKFYLINKIKEDIKGKNRTALIVTHDVKEAVSLADKIFVLSQGKIVYENARVTEETEKELFDFMINLKKF